VIGWPRNFIRDDRKELLRRLELLNRDDREGRLKPYDDEGRRRECLHWVLEPDPTASAANDAVGQGMPVTIDRNLMLDLMQQILFRGAQGALNTLAGLKPNGLPAGKLGPPRAVILWLLYDCRQQVRAGERRVKFERDLRLRVKASDLGLPDVKKKITEAHAIAVAFERAAGRLDPMKPAPEVISGIDDVQGWVNLFLPEATPMYPSLLGAASARPRSHEVIARDAALGCFAVVMAGFIKPLPYELIGEVAAVALQTEKPIGARMVHHHYRNFLEVRGCCDIV
jgi:hypothetical protein